MPNPDLPLTPIPSITDGWLSPARHCASSNFNQRPAGESIRLLVIHNISLPPKQFGGGYIEDFFCNRLDASQHPYFQDIHTLKVSAHLLITRGGEYVQFVAFDQRAWHAGQSCYQGRKDCNDFSIGVELEGADDIAYTAEQYRALAALSQALMAEYPAITPQHIVGHSDIAPGRKTDPGAAFEWARYRDLLDTESLV